MASLSKFGSLREKFAGLVDFVTIYIAEAHPAERKHFSGNFSIDTHTNIELRMEAADTLMEEAGDNLKGCPILVSITLVQTDAKFYPLRLIPWIMQLITHMPLFQKGFTS